MATGLQKAQSSTHRAVEELRDLILTAKLPAGSNHLESELAERLGMSRTPVREATLILEAQGLLEVRPRKGVKILPLSSSDMRDIYDILTELESLSAERAAEIGYEEKNLSKLAESIDRMETALAEEDREAWAEADEAFHTELVRLGGNARVINVVSMFNDQVRRARAVTLYIRPLPLKSNEDHKKLYDAIKLGDALGARAIHTAHRRAARDMLTDLLAKHGFHSV